MSSFADIAQLTKYCTANADQGICILNDSMTSLAEAVDVFFLLYAAALVFIMQTGFAMLCAGSVRQKNVKNIMLKNLLDASFGALAYFAIGYAFQYSEGNNFIGHEAGYFFLKGFTTGEEYIHFFFQFAFAATAATIVAGTVAERCKMEAYCCYSVMLTAFVYPVIAHSAWNVQGFLSAFNPDPFRDIGMIDFAGSGVVHMTGGVTALVAAIILGPRKGRFHDEDGNLLAEPKAFPPHSVALQVLGTFILWFGWYGFNPGSTGYITPAGYNDVSALAAVTTTLSAASGCVSGMFTDTLLGYLRTGEAEYDLTFAMNGALSGLVGVTAGCAVVAPWAAVVIGMIAGWMYNFATHFIVKFHVDDAVDAIPVHLFSGIWGLIAVGLFAEGSRIALYYGEPASQHEGWFYSWGKGSGDANLLLCQFCAVLWISGWVVALMTPFFLLLNFFGLFRVDALEEEVGLDISHHKGSAYDLSAAKKKDVEEFVARRSTVHGKVEAPKEDVPAAAQAGSEEP